jgi:hypothetical protein
MGGRAAGMVFRIQAPDENNLISTRDRGNGQRNLALLLVDHISAHQPVLEGVWLLITLPENSILTMVPVYPDQLHQEPSLAEDFRMTEAHQPSSEFLDLLTEQVLWDHYLVVDREGISFLLDTFEAAGIDTSITNADISALADRQLTLEQQTSLWQSMCAYLSRIDDRHEFEILFNQVSSKFSTNLSLEELPLYPWRAEINGAGLSCEFPTLNFVSP